MVYYTDEGRLGVDMWWKVVAWLSRRITLKVTDEVCNEKFNPRLSGTSRFNFGSDPQKMLLIVVFVVEGGFLWHVKFDKGRLWMYIGVVKVGLH